MAAVSSTTGRLTTLTSTEMFDAFVSRNQAVVIIFTDKNKIDSNQYVSKIAPLVRQTPYISWAEVPTHSVEVEEVEQAPVTSGYVAGVYIGAFDGNNVAKLYQLLDQILMRLGKPAAFSVAGRSQQASSQVPAIAYTPVAVTPNQQMTAVVPTGKAAALESTGPRQVKSSAEINSLLSSKNGLIFFKKQGCGPCEDFWPSYVSAANNNSQLLFLYVMNYDYTPKVGVNGFQGFPYIQAWKDGKLVDWFSGGNLLKLKTAISMVSK